VSPDTKIAVVGAGIAGLAVGIAAARQKCRVTLIDSAAARGDGSVLLLWPNGMKAAAALGLAEEIAGTGTTVRRTEFKLWNGARLWELDVDSFEKKHGAAAVLISREHLVKVLRAALPATVPPLVQAQCTGFTVFGEGVAPILAASSAGGVHDGLIGCDGLRSTIRAQLRPHDECPRSAHHSAWIGLSDVTSGEWDYDVGHTVTFHGHGLRLCASTMKEPGDIAGTRRVYWYATEAVSELRKDGVVLTQRQLVELFATVSTGAAALIEKSLTNARLAPTRIPVEDRVPVRRWSWGRVTLAGDAAHPSTPDLGQGACQALESAAVLGRCLAGSEEVEKALRRFERLRLERTARVTEMSRLTGIQSTTRGPLVEPLRELGIRALLPTIAEKEFESLFSVET